MPRPVKNTKTQSDTPAAPAPKKGGVDRGAFNKKLASYQDAYAQADSDYTPPDGTYHAILTDIREGEYTPKSGKNQGKAQVFVKPVFEILQTEDGDDSLAGQVFSIFCSTVNLGGLKRTFAAINGEVLDDLQLAVEEARKAINVAFVVKVYQKGKYTNYDILEALEEGPANGNGDDGN